MAAVRREVDELDRACSRFREDSELSALNRNVGAEWQVGPLLLESVSVALDAARLTDGLVDPTIGSALIALGYDRDFESLQAQPRARFVEVAGWRRVRIDRQRSTIRVPSGVALDLGATAKALGADRAARIAHDEVGCGVLVGLSGDIAVAGQAPPGGWRVRVTDDHRAGTDAPGQWVSIRSGGLASSSTLTRRWPAGCGLVHHLVDPASGRPAKVVWRTASVAASSCLGANIASTASILRGNGAPEWLRGLGLPSRLVSADAMALHLCGWPEEGDDLTANWSGEGRASGHIAAFVA
jgi:thiamine biosynthesis lipoprotein